MMKDTVNDTLQALRILFRLARERHDSGVMSLTIRDGRVTEISFKSKKETYLRMVDLSKLPSVTQTGRNADSLTDKLIDGRIRCR